MDTKVEFEIVEISQGLFGKLSPSTIKKRLSKYYHEGYRIVSTEWLINRYFLFWNRQTVFVFLEKEL